MSTGSFAQQKYPANYFDSPLKIPIVLSGTFGELRNNHFHSGLDIKTQGKEGLGVYAPADGYVSRIKIGQYGFGKALYITHPNGYTTVYAHLSRYNSEIQDYVKRRQYQKERYAIGNMTIAPGVFPVKKGDLVAYTGNTGGSSGPHLHYEIRDTATEHIINPMHFGLTPKDSIPPVFKKLLAYPSAGARVNQSAKKTTIPFKKTGKQSYVTNRILANGTIGFGVQAYDQLNNAYNKNGLYSLEMTVNGKRVYYHDLETFSFPESKYINLLIDYAYYATYRKRIQKTHKTNGNKLQLYKDLANKGRINIVAGNDYQVIITAKDFQGNKSTLQIPIKGVASTVLFQEKDSTAYKITARQFQKFQTEKVSVAFPKNTFYEDCHIEFSATDSTANVHKPTIPLDKKMTLTFNTSGYSEAVKKQLYIANTNYKKYPRFQFSKQRKNKIFTTTKTLGSYALLIDNKKPTVYKVSFNEGQWISKHRTLTVQIDDKESGISEFRGSIDGQWILMEYNHQKKQLTYAFNDQKLIGSKHVFTLLVSDQVGNTKTLTRTFYKKD